MVRIKERVLLGLVKAVLIVPVLSTAALVQTAGAEEGSDLVLEEIVVTADRRNSFSADFVQVGNFRDARLLDTPYTANIMTKELLESQQALDLSDATRNSAGVTSHQINSTVFSNLAIRGIVTGFSTNYRLNGMHPVINRIHMPLENKERVEVLKGAGGLFYGFASPSGIVNMVTERPVEDLLSLSVTGNSHGAIGGTIDASDIWGNHGVRVNAAASTIETGIDRTEGSRYFASLAYDWKPTEKFTFKFDGEYIDQEVTEPTLIFVNAPVDGVITLPPLQPADTNTGFEWLKSEISAYNLIGKIQYDFTPAWSARVSTGYSYLDTFRRFSGFFGFDPTTGDGTVRVTSFPENTFDRWYFQGDVAGVFATGPLKHEVIFGASHDALDIQTPRGVAQGSITQNLFNPTAVLPELPKPPLTIANLTENRDTGLYFVDRITVTEWLQVTGGVRFTDYSSESFTSDSDISPTTFSGSVVLKPQDWISVYGSFIEGLEEGGIAPGVSNNAGEVLPAAVSEQWEAGIKLEPKRGLLVTAAYFDISREQSFLNAANFFVLDGKGSFTGFEFGVNGELLENLSIGASATFLDAEQESGSAALIGNDIEGTPEFSGSLFAQYKIPQVPGLSINGGVFRTGKRAVNAANNAYAAGYTLFDLGASYEVDIGGRPVLFRVNGHNITGKRHWEAAASGLIQQGPPSVVKFSVSTTF